MATQAKDVSKPVDAAIDPAQKVMLMQAITQLDMLALAFANAPERVKKASQEFSESLKEWANA